MTDADVVDFEDSGDELELEEREAEHDDRTTTNYDSTGGGAQGKARGKTKGRGFATKTGDQSRYSGKAGKFESIGGSGSGPAKSVEGWIVFVTGVHEEAQEEDVLDEFREFGEVISIDVNIDRRTGYVKGYALVEFAKFAEAEEAIKASVKIMGKEVSSSWCFSKGPCRKVSLPSN